MLMLLVHWVTLSETVPNSVARSSRYGLLHHCSVIATSGHSRHSHHECVLLMQCKNCAYTQVHVVQSSSILSRFRQACARFIAVVPCVQTGALQALLKTVMGPDSTADGRRPASGGEGNSPVKIALFSIGNMCAHKECRYGMVCASWCLLHSRYVNM